MSPIGQNLLPGAPSVHRSSQASTDIACNPSTNAAASSTVGQCDELLVRDRGGAGTSCARRSRPRRATGWRSGRPQL